MPQQQGKRSYKKIFLTIGLLLVGGVIAFQALKRPVSLISSDFFYPFLEVPSQVKSTISDQSIHIRDKADILSSLKALQKENLRLKVQNSIYQNLKAENSTLRNLLKIKTQTKYKCIFAKIIQRDPLYWEERVKINIGKKDGVIEGALVLSCIKDSNKKVIPVVLGRIRTVSEHTSIINTIVSNNIGLSVTVKRLNENGIISGGGRIKNKVFSKVKYLSRRPDYKVGDKLYTSGLTPWTPKGLNPDSHASGLFVGTISKEIRLHDNLYYEAKVKPAADLNNINFIMVIIKEFKR